MNSIDTSYIRNLEFFLQHSDEDEVDSSIFLKEFTQSGDLEWLDVGAGPGTKLIRILRKGLAKRGNVKLDIVEPSEMWMRILTENFKQNNLYALIRRKYQMKWEDFNENRKYDIVTFFHSVYGIKLESLSKIPVFLKENRCACIVVESPDSDLRQIKKRLFPYVHHKEVVSSSFDAVVSFLNNRGLKYRISGDEPQMFYVDELIDERNPKRMIPLSFILQTKPEDHNKFVSPRVLKELDQALKEIVKTDEEGKHYICTPDRFIWVYR